MELQVSEVSRRGPLLSWNKGYAFVLVCLVALLFLILPLGLTQQGRVALALTMAAIVMWIFEVIPVELTAMLLCTCYVMFGVANEAEAFSGYANSTTWFVLFALVFGFAVDRSGVGKRLAYNLMRISGNSLISMYVPIIITGLILTFLTPAGVERIVILYPICAVIAKSFAEGNMSDSNVGKLSAAIAYLAGNTFGFGLLTGITVNILGLGIIKSILGIQIYWTQYFVWFFLPAVVITIISIILMFRVFPPEKTRIQGGKETLAKELESLGKMTAKEKRAVVYLGLTLLFWVTGQINHIQPWAVAAIAACLFCAPKIGVLSVEDLRKIPVHVVIFSGAAISMGVVLTKTGAAGHLGNILLGAFIHPGMSHQLTGLATLLAGVLAHFPLTETHTAAAGYTPLVAAFFKGKGMYALGPSALAVFTADTIGFFPIMVMPSLLLLSWISNKDTIKILSVYSLVSIVVNIIAVFTWYHWTGLL